MHVTIRLSLAILTLILIPGFVQATEPSKLFTHYELQHVRVKTPGLFAHSNTFIVEFNRLSDQDWCFPIPGAKLISDYGPRGGRAHTGIDLKIGANDTIYAAFRGTVRMAKPYGSYGNVIVIRHINGMETLYSHNSKNLVKPGDHVKSGDPIAISGRTGRATTEHLHFEVRINGAHVNPHIFFDMKEQKLKKRCLECTKRGDNVAIKPINPLPVRDKSNQMASAR